METKDSFEKLALDYAKFLSNGPICDNILSFLEKEYQISLKKDDLVNVMAFGTTEPQEDWKKNCLKTSSYKPLPSGPQEIHLGMSTDVNDINTKCMYFFKKGKNKGKPCGKTTMHGNAYCNPCIKNRKLKEGPPGEELIKIVRESLKQLVSDPDVQLPGFTKSKGAKPTETWKLLPLKSREDGSGLYILNKSVVWR